jgi:hypothetical protein
MFSVYVCLQAASGLRLQIVDKMTKKPLGGSVQVASPGGTRSYTIPPNSNGTVFLLLVPDIKYTVTVKPEVPDKCWVYRVAKKQILQPGRQKVITGTGLQGLARKEVIYGERITRQSVFGQGLVSSTACAAATEKAQVKRGL